MYEGALMIVCLALVTQDRFVFTAPDYTSELYGSFSAGSRCRMEDGSQGTCIALPDCPMRIQQVLKGQRFSTSAGRCSFDGGVEIVCCPEENSPTQPKNNPSSAVTSRSRDTIQSTTVRTTTLETTEAANDFNDHHINSIDRLTSRPAGVACQEHENEVTGEDGEEVQINILGGKNATFAEFPYMVALGYPTDKNNSLKYNCGGTLISVRHVLTAAHCVSNINNYVPVEAKLGIVNLEDNSDYVQRIPVGDIIVHPKYRRSMKYNDIAVIKLQRSATIAKNVRPICLQTYELSNLDVLFNQSVVVTGWGVTNSESEGTNILQKAPGLRLIKRVECARPYSGKLFEKQLPRGIDESMICVLDKNVTRRSDACQGDSGGPLLLGSDVTNRLIGVTSFGQSCGSSIPAIYTSVYFYLDWIERVVWPK